MHVKLMTMQGQTGKNSGYPYFDGTLKEYPSSAGGGTPSRSFITMQLIKENW
jgi:hypothetical protein